MPGNNLRLLSLDGGGVRGLSTLMIIDHLMSSVNPDSPPKPCEYFDMIGGTSTGGLIAIMLGRLEMTVEDCIECYTALADQVFQKTRHRVSWTGNLQGRFDSTALERVVKQILSNRGVDEDMLLQSKPDAICKVYVAGPLWLLLLTGHMCNSFVCATSKQTSANVCLTSYRSPRRPSQLFKSTKIWEACRATSAATTFFDPISIGKYGQEFVDGALGVNNPVNMVWSEAQDIWGPDLRARLGCLVSVGTGVPSLTPFQDDLLHIGESLKALATETERTAESFRRLHSDLDSEGRYYRFSVNRGLETIGLEESEKKHIIAAATEDYVESQEVYKQMKTFADTDAIITHPTLPDKSQTGVTTQRGQSFLQSLAFPNMNQRSRDLEAPTEETCSWFLEHKAFIDWFHHKNHKQSYGLLWLRGKPGSGKSTILKEAFIRAKKMSTSLLASFFFNAKGDSLEHSLDGMLRSILYQMCSQSPDLLNGLLDFDWSHRGPSSAEEITDWTTVELRAFFHEAVISLKMSTIIFIDAIDECNRDSVRAVADFWREITKTASSNGLHLCVCVSSRHFPSISVNHCPEITMEDYNYGDISKFVSRRLGLGMRAESIDRQAVQDKIMEKSQGVFLWASLVVKDLLEQHDEGQPLALLLKNLDSVPQELEDLFTHLLTTAPSPMVVRMFQWALLPDKKLRLHEWEHILAFIQEDPPSSLRQFKGSDKKTDAQLERRITTLSRGLLSFNIRSGGYTSHESADEWKSVDDSKSNQAGAGSLDLDVGESRVVQVIHESVRQYFMEGPGFAVLSPESTEGSGKSLARAHLSIMDTCLNYIMIEELDELIAARQEVQRKAQQRFRVGSSGETDAGESLRGRLKRAKVPPLNWDLEWNMNHRSTSVASFSSAGSHNRGRSISPVKTSSGTRSREWDTSHLVANSLLLEGSDDGRLDFADLERMDWPTQYNDITSRWLENQEVVEDHDFCDETASLSQPETSVTGNSQLLPGHAALLSYVTFELFTHAIKANTEGVDPSHIVERLRGCAWDRWKALREDYDEREHDFLYFAAKLGLSFWLKADNSWDEGEVVSSVRHAIDSEDSKVLETLLNAFPSVGFSKEISGIVLGFQIRAADTAQLETYI